MTATVVRRSTLPLPADVVWDRVTTPAGIRHELRPILTMTMPPGLRGRTLADADHLVGRPLGKAWLLLLGVLPVDFDDMTLAEVGERRFHERSQMLLLPSWQHEREVVPVGNGCEVTDRLTFDARLRVLEPLARRVVELLFAHRHRRLTRWAGG